MNSAACENCGNIYDKPMQIITNGDAHYFDCFECAINKMAPHCAHCETRIIGHGLEKNGMMFCCSHCASVKGAPELRDRI